MIITYSRIDTGTCLQVQVPSVRYSHSRTGGGSVNYDGEHTSQSSLSERESSAASQPTTVSVFISL